MLKINPGDLVKRTDENSNSIYRVTMYCIERVHHTSNMEVYTIVEQVNLEDCKTKLVTFNVPLKNIELYLPEFK